jgi:site-specific recombinase XerD
LNIEDISLTTGEVLIRKGKGNKSRYVFIGEHARQALRKYLKKRRDNYPAIWITHPSVDTGRLTYSGLRSMIKRRATKANVEPPSLHDFRRAFALTMLRNGTDIFTLAKLMGHKGITVLQRYLRETRQDPEIAHRRASPVDTGFYSS